MGKKGYSSGFEFTPRYPSVLDHPLGVDPRTWRIVKAGLATWAELDMWSLLDVCHAEAYLEACAECEEAART